MAEKHFVYNESKHLVATLESSINLVDTFAFPFRALTPLWAPASLVILLGCASLSPSSSTKCTTKPPEEIKGLSSKGTGMTISGQPGGRGYFPLKQDPENRLLQGSDISWSAFQIGRIKNSRKVKLRIIGFLGHFDLGLNQAWCLYLIT